MAIKSARGQVGKPTSVEAFEINMADAHHLVRIAEALTNTRARRMRRELRDRVGEALKVAPKHRSELDCLQSSHIFVTFLPGSGVKRSDFDDARPLLRQAIVAGCAAGETYLADRTMELVGGLTSKERATPRLNAIPMDIHAWLEIEDRYERRKWGLRGLVIEPYIRREASTDPTKVGHLLSLVGVSDWSSKLDKARGVGRGETVKFLSRVTARRNKIAHEGDRIGRGRAQLTVAEARSDLDGLVSVAHGIQVITEGAT